MASRLPSDISVLIVTYNNEKTIDACLRSVLSGDSLPHEILILDNASTDRTFSKIDQFSDVKVIRSNRNIGFAAGINKLARQATGDFVFMLNPDCEVPPNFLVRLSEFCAAHEGAVAPGLVYPDGSIQLSARNFPNHRNILFSRKSPLSWLGLADEASAGYLNLKSAAKVPAVAATAFMISRHVFNRLGGFDERFFLYFEDIDLCWRLQKSSIDIWYVPEIKVIHLLGGSSGRFDIGTLFHHHRSAMLFFAKHYPEKLFANLGLALMLVAGFVVSSIYKLTIGLMRK